MPSPTPGSVTRAAELLHMVQLAVSRQLKLLDEDVGAHLFERDRPASTARTRCGPNGNPANAGPDFGGLLPSSGELLTGPLIGALQQPYPQIRVSISVGYTDHLLSWLESGEIDAALLYDPKPSLALDVTPLVEESLSLVGLAALGLNDDAPVTVQALGQGPPVLPSPPHGLRSLVEHACAVAGVPLMVVAKTNALSVQKALVVQGYGLSVMPRVAVQSEIKHGLFSAARIDEPEFLRRIVLALPTTRRTSTAVRCATAALQACVKEIACSGNWLGARWLGD